MGQSQVVQSSPDDIAAQLTQLELEKLNEIFKFDSSDSYGQSSQDNYLDSWSQYVLLLTCNVCDVFIFLGFLDELCLLALSDSPVVINYVKI